MIHPNAGDHVERDHDGCRHRPEALDRALRAAVSGLQPHQRGRRHEHECSRFSCWPPARSAGSRQRRSGRARVGNLARQIARGERRRASSTDHTGAAGEPERIASADRVLAARGAMRKTAVQTASPARSCGSRRRRRRSSIGPARVSATRHSALRRRGDPSRLKASRVLALLRRPAVIGIGITRSCGPATSYRYVHQRLRRRGSGVSHRIEIVRF